MTKIDTEAIRQDIVNQAIKNIDNLAEFTPQMICDAAGVDSGWIKYFWGEKPETFMTAMRREYKNHAACEILHDELEKNDYFHAVNFRDLSENSKLALSDALQAAVKFLNDG